LPRIDVSVSGLLPLALTAARFPRRVDPGAMVAAGDLERLAICFPEFLAARLGELATLGTGLGAPPGFAAALTARAEASHAGGGEAPGALARRLGIDAGAAALVAMALPGLGALRRRDIAGLAALDAPGPGPVPLSRLFRLLLLAVRLRRPDMVGGAVDGSLGSVLDWVLLFGLPEFRLWHLLPPGDRSVLLAGHGSAPPLFLRAALRFRTDLRALSGDGLALREWLRRSASAEYRIDLAEPPPAPPQQAGRISVIGPWRQVLGIADDCFSAARALGALGADFEVLAARPTRFIEIDRDKERALRDRAVDVATGGRALFCDTLFEATFWAFANWRRFQAFDRVDLFAPWELPALPPGWDAATRLYDTILTPSLFTRAVFVDAGAARVLRLCSSIELSGGGAPAAALALRRRLRLPAKARVFACVFDFSSVMRRKNPQAAIAAFLRLRRQVPRAVLVVKTTRGRRNRAATRRLAALLRGAPGIVWVDGAWTNLAVEGLLRRADALVSLHRSEGFGRNIGKALLLGRRAVVTDWSGNADFRPEPGYVGVPYRLRPVAETDYFAGGGQVWAEPDVPAAARAMRRALAATPRTPGPHTALRFSRGRFAHRLGRALALH